MVTKFIFFGSVLIFIATLAFFLSWNYVIVNLPIKGITIGYLEFQLAVKLSLASFAIQFIGLLAVKGISKLFNR